MATVNDIVKEGYGIYDEFERLPKELVIERLNMYPYMCIYTTRQKDKFNRLHIYKGTLLKDSYYRYFIKYNNYLFSIKYKLSQINKTLWEDLGFKFNRSKYNRPKIYLNESDLTILLKDIRGK